MDQSSYQFFCNFFYLRTILKENSIFLNLLNFAKKSNNNQDSNASFDFIENQGLKVNIHIHLIQFYVMIHKTYSGMHFIHKLGLFCCISKKPKKFMINVLTNFEMNTVPYVLIPFLTLSDFFLFKLGSYSNSWWYLEQGGRLTSSMQLVAEV